MKTKLMLLVQMAVIAATGACSLIVFAHRKHGSELRLRPRVFPYEPGEVPLEKEQPVVPIIQGLDIGHGLRFRELNLNAKISKGGSADSNSHPKRQEILWVIVPYSAVQGVVVG